MSDVPDYIETLKCDATPEQRRELEAAWAEYVKGSGQSGQSVQVFDCSDDPVERQVGMLVANLPADSTGVLIVKVRGDDVTYSAIDHLGMTLRRVIDAAGLCMTVMVVLENDGQSFDFQLLTNEQLHDIGFKRVEPVPDFLNITRDVV
jgi:hypothetical protein